MNTSRGGISRGFTLIEIVISTSIFFVIALVVCSMFASGLNIWKKNNEIIFFEHKIATGLEKLSKDLRNTFKFSEDTFKGVGFEGEDDSVAFASLVEGGIGRTVYFLNDEKVFCKKQETYQEYANNTEKDLCAKLISNVEGLCFSYCYIDSMNPGVYKWVSEWDNSYSDNIPIAVKIELVIEREYGQKREFKKTILMPMETSEQR